MPSLKPTKFWPYLVRLDPTAINRMAGTVQSVRSTGILNEKDVRIFEEKAVLRMHEHLILTQQ